MDTHLSFIIEFTGLVVKEKLQVFATKSCKRDFCVLHSYLQIACTVPYTCECVHLVLDYVALLYFQYLVVAYSYLVWIGLR